jgi:hypothetical protein
VLVSARTGRGVTGMTAIAEQDADLRAAVIWKQAQT